MRYHPFLKFNAFFEIKIENLYIPMKLTVRYYTVQLKLAAYLLYCLSYCQT